MVRCNCHVHSLVLVPNRQTCWQISSASMFTPTRTSPPSRLTSFFALPHPLAWPHLTLTPHLTLASLLTRTLAIACARARTQLFPALSPSASALHPHPQLDPRLSPSLTPSALVTQRNARHPHHPASLLTFVHCFRHGTNRGHHVKQWIQRRAHVCDWDCCSITTSPTSPTSLATNTATNTVRRGAMRCQLPRAAGRP